MIARLNNNMYTKIKREGRKYCKLYVDVKYTHVGGKFQKNSTEEYCVVQYSTRPVCDHWCWKMLDKWWWSWWCLTCALVSDTWQHLTDCHWCWWLAQVSLEDRWCQVSTVLCSSRYSVAQMMWCQLCRNRLDLKTIQHNARSIVSS